MKYKTPLAIAAVLVTGSIIAFSYLKASRTIPEIVMPEKMISNETEKTVSEPAQAPENEIYLGQQTSPEEKEDKLCGWIDESDMVIQLEFADGVEKDTSYETGFYFSSIESSMRLARRGCDYRTGFKYEEMKGKGAVQIGVRGYNDNLRRKLENEPISVIFDSEGKPNIEFPVVVRVLN